MIGRHTLKHITERVAVLSGAAALVRQRLGRRGDAIVLAYHNIVPHGESPVGDRSLHLQQRDFAHQLDRLMDTHEVVPLNALLHPRTKRSARPRAAITFDDAYTGTIVAGGEELRKRNLPATIFVAPAFLNGGTFWWDAIASPTDEGLSPGARQAALTDARGYTPAVLNWARQQGMTIHEMPAHARCTTEHELHALLHDSRITLGSHTWNHPNLSVLTPQELTDELHRSREWLVPFGDRAIPWITYPYGHCTPLVWEIARTTGYSAGCLIEGGWATPVLANPYAVPRLNIPAGVSPDGFVLRTSGVMA